MKDSVLYAYERIFNKVPEPTPLNAVAEISETSESGESDDGTEITPLQGSGTGFLT